MLTTQKRWREVQEASADPIARAPAIVRHVDYREAHRAYVSDQQLALDRWIDAFGAAVQRAAWHDEFVTFAIREEDGAQIRIDLIDRDGACTCTTAPFAWRTIAPDRAAESFVTALRARRMV